MLRRGNRISRGNIFIASVNWLWIAIKESPLHVSLLHKRWRLLLIGGDIVRSYVGRALVTEAADALFVCGLDTIVLEFSTNNSAFIYRPSLDVTLTRPKKPYFSYGTLFVAFSVSLVFRYCLNRKRSRANDNVLRLICTIDVPLGAALSSKNIGLEWLINGWKVGRSYVDELHGWF